MSYKMGEFDVAVVGAGHAGVEAALASARIGCKTVMFTISLDQIANMPCNPSIGGTAKGHLVRELAFVGQVLFDTGACLLIGGEEVVAFQNQFSVSSQLMVRI